MKTHLILCGLASIVFSASAAEAAVTGSLGGGTGTFLTLSGAGLNGGTVATLSGGQVLTSDQPFADIPAGGVFGNAFLAAGPTVGQPAALTFTVPVSYLSFLWGSPDLYNVLTIQSTGGTQIFTAAGLGFPVTNGDQSFSQYVQFSATAGDFITSASFTNVPSTDAFETANYSITSGVPEPATWAMMLMGFGAVGFAMRRRKQTELTFRRAA
jgi:hypothetical protein